MHILAVGIFLKNKGGKHMKLRDQLPELVGETAWLNGKTNERELVCDKPTLIHFWSLMTVTYVRKQCLKSMRLKTNIKKI